MPAEPLRASPVGSPPAAEAAVEAARKSLRTRSSRDARAKLIDALGALAGQRANAGDEAAAGEALAEAEALLPSQLPAAEAWRARAVALFRAKGALAQRRHSHADAAAAFEAALSRLPPANGSAPDADAARLQLIVRLVRSRLALGQPVEAIADIRRCEDLLDTLHGKIPAEALETIRAAVLGHEGAALSMLDRLSEAEAKFAASMEILHRRPAAGTEQLLRQTIEGWAATLRRQGRHADAAALVAQSAAGREREEHRHGPDCGCGGHDHAHDHHHAAPARHEHAHGPTCGCSGHAGHAHGAPR